eukprot:CAMPEP_0175876102 /NCGR_PEP_ID=MMETSP0107_2-20121207/39842_1 /TAXON_ID=195067 ORGANISM="Goniomonas pacifica, Strain CCMP1869" /NCGR_SAMPLE_ID=MMETSP0107_2 /ASSEMBLY_ACC=CAM_ASM_000203 /LENGTH=117 /DNA_ID=CAMNT_0017195231 /DNA_START=141 /DNA_END=491 /DNA_ORIENTATION=+
MTFPVAPPRVVDDDFDEMRRVAHALGGDEAVRQKAHTPFVQRELRMNVRTVDQPGKVFSDTPLELVDRFCFSPGPLESAARDHADTTPLIGVEQHVLVQILIVRRADLRRVTDAEHR